MVELIPDPRNLSLAMREAEIAVRLTRPDQHDLVVRRVGDLAFGLYAGPAYLERYGEPDFQAGCPGHYLITQLDDVQDAAQTGWLADLTPRARVAVQTNSHEAAVAAALSGSGLACLARIRAERKPGCVDWKLLPPFHAPASGSSCTVTTAATPGSGPP